MIPGPLACGATTGKVALIIGILQIIFKSRKEPNEEHDSELPR
jgi:hypothetical protein